MKNPQEVHNNYRLSPNRVKIVIVFDIFFCSDLARSIKFFLSYNYWINILDYEITYTRVPITLD